MIVEIDPNQFMIKVDKHSKLNKSRNEQGSCSVD